jgi:hypothetical protein
MEGMGVPVGRKSRRGHGFAIVMRRPAPDLSRTVGLTSSMMCRNGNAGLATTIDKSRPHGAAQNRRDYPAMNNRNHGRSEFFAPPILGFATDSPDKI